MEKEFCNYNQALALKELGFDKPCLTYYFSDGLFNDAAEEDNTLYPGDPRFYEDTNSILSKYLENDSKYNAVAAPLKQQVFRWFREKQWLYSEIFIDDNKTFGYLISYFIEEGRADKPLQRNYNTYEEAEDACINKLIEITKDAISNN